ncbi:MAG: 4'-phosphopantetheinyl transferase superfamily protein [Spirochaetales bacterium]|nr:4'-phosphopantetheinyl transferase superfamily protein [Spirochaetales bacterium]
MTRPKIFLCSYDKKNGSGREQLRGIIETELSLPAGSVKYGEEPNGKPFLLGFSEVHISISHSKDLIALYIGHDEAGIDIEHLKPRTNAGDIASLYFSGEEQKDIHKEGKDSLILFYKIWTTKEAELKRLGSGIGSIHRLNTSIIPIGRHWLIGKKYILCLSAPEPVLQSLEIISLLDTIPKITFYDHS